MPSNYSTSLRKKDSRLLLSKVLSSSISKSVSIGTVE